MKCLRLVLLILLVFCSGCMYRGSLKDNFYATASESEKIPLKAYLVLGSNLENLTYHADNVFFSHGVDINTMPGLAASFNSAFSSTFESVYASSRVEPQTVTNYDVIVVPRVELVNNVLTLSAALKDASDDTAIGLFHSSSNIYTTVPTSAHILATVNGFPFLGLTTPIVAPIITMIIGNQAEADLESSLRQSLTTITDDIKNDRALVSRVKRKGA